MSHKLSFDELEPGVAWRRALQLGRGKALEQIDAAGLRGRGGAGFPTGRKWHLTKEIDEKTKYLVCNADEGEPGTFKDRWILEHYSPLVIEGMAIAAWIVGATKAFMYLRAEYAYLAEMLIANLSAYLDRYRTEEGYLDATLRVGAGAYICGEETGLIESLEGKRGEPRDRPPYPVTAGYDGKPTVVNNVETFAWAACILARGADWFLSNSIHRCDGPKIFSVSGDCSTPGVYELPMGISIHDLLAQVGGTGAKAVQVGGAAGVCVPAEQFQKRIAYEEAPPNGSIIVFGPERDMLVVLENFMEFFADESCGQCTPCRIGCVELLNGVCALQAGRCSMKRLQQLWRLCATMREACKCGLGQTAPNAFLSITHAFFNEIMGRPRQGNIREILP